MEIERERRVKLSFIYSDRGEPKFASELPSSQCKKRNTVNYKIKSIDLGKINQLFRKGQLFLVLRSERNFSLRSSKRGNSVML
mgnify:CR=1 FL=1